MIHPTLFADRVQMAFHPTPRGVVGLVDDLLGLCRHYQLQMRFQDGHCVIRRLGAEAEESLDITVPKSVFRAAIARVAAICNEQRPESVTPYRGEGNITLLPPDLQCSEKESPPSTCYVSFTNTPFDQHLEIRFSSSSAGDKNLFTVLLRDKRTVTVFGDALQYVQNSSNLTDYGSYGILSRTDRGAVLMALFRVSEVIGVFSGDIRDPGVLEETKRETQRQKALADDRQGI